jgi:hypothetical protein
MRSPPSIGWVREVVVRALRKLRDGGLIAHIDDDTLQLIPPGAASPYRAPVVHGLLGVSYAYHVDQLRMSALPAIAPDFD